MVLMEVLREAGNLGFNKPVPDRLRNRTPTKELWNFLEIRKCRRRKAYGRGSRSSSLRSLREKGQKTGGTET